MAGLIPKLFLRCLRTSGQLTRLCTTPYTIASVPNKQNFLPITAPYNSNLRLYCTPSTEEPNQLYYVRLRGFPWETTDADILSFMGVKEEDVVRLYHPVNQKQNSYGRAVAVLKDQSTFDSVLKKNREYVGTRYIEVEETDEQGLKDSESFDDHKLQQRQPILCIRGLPWSAEDKDIRQFFEGVQIKDRGIDIVLDQDGNGSGVAFVEFVDEDNCQEAMKRNKDYMGDRYLNLSFSNERRRAQFIREGMFADKSGGRSYRGRPDRPDGAFSYESTIAPRNNAVRVRGLPFEVTEQQVMDFFKEVELHPTLVELFTDQHTGRPTGSGRIEFGSLEQVQEAIDKRNKCYIGNRYVDVRAEY